MASRLRCCHRAVAVGQMGGSMNDEALGDGPPCLSTARASGGRQRGRAGLEAGYDAAGWVCGLLAAGWVTRDVAEIAQPAPLILIARAALAVCFVSVGSGLLAGLYRGRY